jgi:hypothetical protein
MTTIHIELTKEEIDIILRALAPMQLAMEARLMLVEGLIKKFDLNLASDKPELAEKHKASIKLVETCNHIGVYLTAKAGL